MTRRDWFPSAVQRAPVLSLVLLPLAGSARFAAAAEPNKAETAAGPAAWAGDLTPIAPAEWNEARAAHLLERAGFGGTPEDIARLANMTPQEAVRHLVRYRQVANVAIPPFDESAKQSLAVQSGLHAPVVFSDPQRFARAGDPSQEPVYQRMVNRQTAQGNQTLSFLQEISATASTSSAQVRAATAKYKTPISYGSHSSVSTLSTDLKKVAALIAAGFPTRVYYVSQGGFDTHGNQLGTQQGLLMYVSDALEGFLKDMNRLGRSQDVALVLFTEFGRRVAENASGGTDHGTATPMFVLGAKVKGGLYGSYPSLTDLDHGDLKMTTDFRSVYATMIKEWMGYGETKQILRGEFATLGVFG